MKEIDKVGLAVIKDKKVLMGRNEDQNAFYFVGGSVEEGESDIEALEREVGEELDTEIDKDSIKYLSQFEAPAHAKENTLLRIKLYKGDLLGEPKPTSEVKELKYFDSSMEEKYSTPISQIIIPWLKKQGYIN